MKKITIVAMAIISLSCQNLYSQELQKPNCVYVELLGQGVLYSINYEHRFNEHLSGRLGFTSWSIEMPLFVVGTVDLTGAPIMLNYLAGGRGHYFEMGIGALVYHVRVSGNEIFFGSEVSGEATNVLLTGTLGYRYQPDGGLLFRVGLTPLTSFKKTFLWVGLGVGVSF